MDTYAVRVITTADEDPNHADNLVEQLAAHSAAIGQANGKLDAQLTIEADSLDDAARRGVRAAIDALRGLGVEATATAVEVMTDEAYEQSLNTPTSVEDLVSTAEAAGILGTSRQRVAQLADTDPDFPPAVQVGRVALRSRAAVARYAQRERRPGRRPANA